MKEMAIVTALLPTVKKKADGGEDDEQRGKDGEKKRKRI